MCLASKAAAAATAAHHTAPTLSEEVIDRALARSPSPPKDQQAPPQNQSTPPRPLSSSGCGGCDDGSVLCCAVLLRPVLYPVAAAGAALL